jgi:hypothetical protein
MWPEDCDKDNIILGGSYVNKYSFECAKLAAGAGIMAVDKLF